MGDALFQPDPEGGFLPHPDPPHELPEMFRAWDEAGRDLPKWLASGCARRWIGRLPRLDPAALPDGPPLERAMMLLSYLGHAWVWGEAEVVDRLPANIAVPWQAVAERLQRPPVLSYASYALWNWTRLDPKEPVALGNIALLQNFLGGLDEEWFILVHVDIEARAAPGLLALSQAQQAVAARDADTLGECLQTVAASVEAMNRTMDRMPEGCDPYVYFHRVRPYIHGWKNNPALPNGLIYEGVSDTPREYAGETGAQSGIIPALDAGLRVTHADDPLRPYLLEMRRYMPAAHRRWLESIEEGPDLRAFVAASADAGLQAAYDACIDGVERFRSRHLEYAAAYINQQAQARPGNPSDVGTGSTPFMPYLRKHRDETGKTRIDG